jgi:hypothetical protein
MAWKLHRSVIAACLVYFREIDPTAFWEFCNTIPLDSRLFRGGGDVRDQTKQGQPPRAHFELGVLLLALPCGLPIQHRLLANHTAACLFVTRGEAFLHADLIGAIYTSGISLSNKRRIHNCEKRNRRKC